jgi:hypothetical protein
MESSDYFESLYSNKFENFEEMDGFIDTYDHSKLNQKDSNHLNRSTTQTKLKQQLRVSQERRVQDLMDTLLNFNRHLKKN